MCTIRFQMRDLFCVLECNLEFADLIFFFKGFVAGVMIATPVGPVGMLCIERTLVKGSLNGFVSGLGAATADLIYSSIVAFGLTVISDFLVGQQMWFRLFGGVFFVFLGLKIYRQQKRQPAKVHEGRGYFGLKIYRQQKRQPAKVHEGRGYLSDYCSAFVVTFFNPVPVFAFIAIFAGLGITGATKLSALMLVGGVFAGSSAWWVGICCFAAVFRNKFKSAHFFWLVKASGVR